LLSLSSDVCRFFDPESGWISLPIERGEWKGITAGGSTDYDSVQQNPQFVLTVKEAGTNVVLNLSQRDSRGTSFKLVPISIEVYRNKGARVTRQKTGVAICTDPYLYRREVSIEQQLPPAVYTILLSTFEPGQETSWTLSTFATKNVTLETCPPMAVTAQKR
jgi:hypothetical protein